MFYFVTLHVSVWVEIQGKADRVYQYRSRSTWACELKYQKPLMNRWWTLSRSTWACELKLSYYEINLNLAKVTLHVSVWVEIWSVLDRWNGTSVTLHVSVWVEIWPHCRLPETKEVTLHVSVWVEMKQLSMLLEVLSHAPRERVSWNMERIRSLERNERHAPRERVSWNMRVLMLDFRLLVTLHVSVWVEMV